MVIFYKALSGVRKLRRYVDRPWYPFALAGLSLLDFFVVIIPTDGVAVVSAMARPKKWVLIALSLAVGSMLGGLLVAELVRVYGDSFVNWLSPGVMASATWQNSENWLEQHGLWALFLVALSPLPQQPSVLFAGLTDMPLYELAIALGLGRSIKFLTYGWIASHAPKLVRRIPALKHELEELEERSPFEASSSSKDR